jgi:hypothetical protein
VDEGEVRRRRRVLGRIGAGVRQTEARTSHAIAGRVIPTWRRVTKGEPRWPVSLAVIAAVVMQGLLPKQVQLVHAWILPAVALVLLVALVIANPTRIVHESPALRFTSGLLIAWITGANILSMIRLLTRVLDGTFHGSPKLLLLTGGAIWLTNVICFALWYWFFDRGGPVDRAHGRAEYPDFMFPQMSDPELAPPDWETGFVDYLYLSFTNASAFSPTDVLPLKRWAKLTMLVQSAISLITVALVIARAVNILKGS